MWKKIGILHASKKHRISKFRRQCIRRPWSNYSAISAIVLMPWHSTESNFSVKGLSMCDFKIKHRKESLKKTIFFLFTREFIFYHIWNLTRICLQIKHEDTWSSLMTVINISWSDSFFHRIHHNAMTIHFYLSNKINTEKKKNSNKIYFHYQVTKARVSYFLCIADK